MRSFALLLCLSCGREPLSQLTLTPPPSEVTHADGTTARLSATFEKRDMFRFSDKELLTETISVEGDELVTETKASNGLAVTGTAAQADLKASLGRFLTLSSADAAGICEVVGPVSSLSEVDPLTCTKWERNGFIHLNTEHVDDARGRGFVVRVAPNAAITLRVLENGRDARGDYVRFEYAPTCLLMKPDVEPRCITTSK